MVFSGTWDDNGPHKWFFFSSVVASISNSSIKAAILFYLFYFLFLQSLGCFIIKKRVYDLNMFRPVRWSYLHFIHAFFSPSVITVYKINANRGLFAPHTYVAVPRIEIKEGMYFCSKLPKTYVWIAHCFSFRTKLTEDIFAK